MGPGGVVPHPPGLDDPSGIAQGQKPVLVEALVAKPAVETFDERVLRGLQGRMNWRCTFRRCAQASRARL
jgi:hypothetical protein